MGPSPNGSSQSAKPLETQHDIANDEGDNILSSGKNSNLLSSCSSSSPNDKLDNPTLDNDNKLDLSTSSAVTPDLSSSSPCNLLITESQPMQAVECFANNSRRIPSSVFSIDQSSDPSHWSTASSESLFSIHIGSLSKDYSLWSDDEHGTPTEVSVDVSDHIIEELKPAETPNGTLKQESRGSEDQTHEKSFDEGRESYSSVKSFAFPILTGDSEKDSLGKLGCSMKLVQEEQKPQPEALPKQQTDPLPQFDQKTTQAKRSAVKKKRLSRFFCCS